MELSRSKFEVKLHYGALREGLRGSFLWRNIWQGQCPEKGGLVLLDHSEGTNLEFG